MKLSFSTSGWDLRFKEFISSAKEYKFQATKKEAESDIFDDVVDAYGSIAEKKIYNYGGTYYIGVKNEDGKMVLRKLKLKGSTSKDAFKPKD